MPRASPSCPLETVWSLSGPKPCKKRRYKLKRCTVARDSRASPAPPPDDRAASGLLMPSFLKRSAAASLKVYAQGQKGSSWPVGRVSHSILAMLGWLGVANVDHAID